MPPGQSMMLRPADFPRGYDAPRPEYAEPQDDDAKGEGKAQGPSERVGCVKLQGRSQGPALA
jgi:hypothetical protein